MSAVRSLLFWAMFLCCRGSAFAAGNWDQNWSDCADLKLPGFQAQIAEFRDFLSRGKKWESAVSAELASIELLAKDTCKKWAENPNGDQPLQEFLRKFSEVSTAALDLKQQADKALHPRIQKWWAQENAEVAPYGFQFGQFPCGAAFQRTQKHVHSLTETLEARILSLKTRCPQAADKIIAEFQGKRKEKIAAEDQAKPRAGARSGKSSVKGSDVSGAEKALQDESVSRRKIGQ